MIVHQTVTPTQLVTLSSTGRSKWLVTWIVNDSIDSARFATVGEAVSFYRILANRMLRVCYGQET